MMEGRVHSIETFGTVDGPGIRYVLFLQGCPLRCRYCHNPDTWRMSGGTLMSVDDIIRDYKKNKAFYARGGITVTGGEPLVQIDFVIELFERARREGIHTCIDTSGVTYDAKNAATLHKFDRLTECTDLVLLDIKHIDDSEHKTLVGCSNRNVLAFAKYLERRGVDVWIRHTVVEGLNDAPEHLAALGEFIGSLKNVKALDVLPYHTMGIGKYKELGIAYPLEGVAPTSPEGAKAAKEIILEAIKRTRKAI